MKRVIFTGDDFGLAVPVNDAIVEAHRRGILTTASLMVGAAAAEDAIDKIRNVPSLRVGLHIVLVEGRPVLPPCEVRDLVNSKGEFSADLVRSGFRFFFKSGVRRQLEMEIRAQFDAFRRTGLALDHVNAHNHMHFHPTVLRLILSVGREFGLRAVRFPCEPPLLTWRAARHSLISRTAGHIFLLPLLLLMKRTLQRLGIRFNDYLFGMGDSGNMNAALVLELLRNLPEGVTEMHFHPATRRCIEIDETMPAYHHEEEFAALTDPSIFLALAEVGAQRIAFADL